MARSCTPWKVERHPSGASPVVRRCADGSRADIVSGGNYYTANVYIRGKWVDRISRPTLAKAKAAASRRMR